MKHISSQTTAYLVMVLDKVFLYRQGKIDLLCNGGVTPNRPTDTITVFPYSLNALLIY